MLFNIIQTTMHQCSALVFSRVPEAYWLESLGIARCPMWCIVVDIAPLWFILAINYMGVSILWITCEYPVDNLGVAQVVARGFLCDPHVTPMFHVKHHPVDNSWVTCEYPVDNSRITCG
jgi:hypothetical protein